MVGPLPGESPSSSCRGWPSCRTAWWCCNSTPPLGIGLALLWLARGLAFRRVLTAAGLMIGAVVFDTLVRGLLTWLGIRWITVTAMMVRSIKWQVLGTNLQGSFSDLLFQPLILAAILTFLVVVLLAIALRRFRSTKKPAQNAPEDGWVAVILLSSTLSGLVPCIILSASIERYCYSATVLPLLALPLALRLAFRECGWRTWAVTGGLGTLLIVLACGVQMVRAALHYPWRPLAQPYPELAQLLDRGAREYGCTQGIGGYWDARWMRYLTHEHVKVLPVAALAAPPFIHGVNPYREVEPHDGGRAFPEMRFLILQNGNLGPNLSEARLMLPSPQVRLPWSRGEVWLYDAFVDDRLTAFIASFRARAWRRSAEVVRPLTPAVLRRSAITTLPKVAMT